MKPRALLRKAGSASFPLAKPTWPTSLERPAPKRRVGLDCDTAWSRRYPARLVRAAVTDFVTVPTTRWFAPQKVVGAEALERLEGPAIFAANHSSHADTAVMLAALPQRFRHKLVVAAASDFFFDSTAKGAAMSLLLGAIPIERAKVNRRSAATALELLAEGWSVLIYPEGGRSPDGWLHDFKGGAAYLSVRSGAPVVPVFMEGTGRILPKAPVAAGDQPGGSGSESTGTARLRRHPVTVLFGRALRPGVDDDARSLGTRIEAAVAELGREVRSDYFTARRTTDDELVRGPVAAAWRREWARPPALPVEARAERDRWPEIS